MRLRILHVDHATVDAEDLQNLLIMAIANRVEEVELALRANSDVLPADRVRLLRVAVDVDVEADAAIRRTGALAPVLYRV